MSKILIINNYKNDEESEEVKSFKKYAGIAGHELCPVFRKFKKEEMEEMLMKSDSMHLSQLRLFLWSLLSSVRVCDKLYVTNHTKEFDQLSRMTVAMYLVMNCPPEIVMMGDIQKILNHFIITESPLNDSEYEYLSNAILLAQYYLKFNKDGGVNDDKNSDYNSGPPVLTYYQPYISSLDIASLKKNLESEFEDFNLSGLQPDENPLTVRTDNFLIYEKNSAHLMDAWLAILFTNSLDSDYDIWTLILEDCPITNLMKLMSNDIIDLERSKFGLRVKKVDDSEVAKPIQKVEEPSNQ
jgi:hypothetical protein